MNDEITPEYLFLNRRRWLQTASIAGSVPVSSAVYRYFNPVDLDVVLQPLLDNLEPPKLGTSERRALGYECGEWTSSLYDITHLNNFQEFTSDQQAVSEKAKNFKTNEWTLEIGGMVENPISLSLNDIRTRFPIEQRVYRMRCVEAWSMVIPWAGFPLSALLEQVRPTSDAKYVAFVSLHDPKRMPNQVLGELQWPYTEGLRLDEAMHPLTILATGMYGRQLPPANGPPVRLVVPWKYGFKSIKSVVKIELVSEQPKTAWNTSSAHEYGFYANVNPAVDHPRWSQASERRIGEMLRRDTLPFNGYAKQVAHLYRGMDLSVDF